MRRPRQRRHVLPLRTCVGCFARAVLFTRAVLCLAALRCTRSVALTVQVHTGCCMGGGGSITATGDRSKEGDLGMTFSDVPVIRSAADE